MPSSARSRLQDERRSLQHQLLIAQQTVADLRQARTQADGDDEHDPEGATVSQQWSHHHGLVVALQRRLAENEEAVARLDEGTYGTCARCGGPIGAGRLEARPSAELCLPCATRR